MQIITVSPEASASGVFHCLKDAIDSIPADNQSPIHIEIAPGVYREKLTLDKPFVTLFGMGKSPADTVITYDDFGNDTMPDGTRRGTFRSYTLFVHAADVTLRNLTVENASGDSATHGQAIALYAECDRFVADSCRLLGHQDTLFTGPLPPKELQPNGFLGPTQFAPRINGRQYYRNCYICGDVDFIFGSATAYFEHCTLESLRRSKANSVASTAASTTENFSPEGYITAASTPEGQEYGYVFHSCHFVSHDCPPASVYLGRPWRDYARTVLIDCALGAHIHPAGFHDWNKPHARESSFYAEYGSHPIDADTENGCLGGCCQPYPHRAGFVCVLDTAQAAYFSREQVLSGADGWCPWKCEA